MKWKTEKWQRKISKSQVGIFEYISKIGEILR